jgi:hypothetical protein
MPVALDLLAAKSVIANIAELGSLMLIIDDFDGVGRSCGLGQSAVGYISFAVVQRFSGS